MSIAVLHRRHADFDLVSLANLVWVLVNDVAERALAPHGAGRAVPWIVCF